MLTTKQRLQIARTVCAARLQNPDLSDLEFAGGQMLLIAAIKRCEQLGIVDPVAVERALNDPEVQRAMLEGLQRSFSQQIRDFIDGPAIPLNLAL